MGSSHQLYTTLFTSLRTLYPAERVTRLRNWVWIVVGLIQSQSVQLSQIALYIPGDTKAVARIARIRRWLAPAALDSRALYDPLIQRVLERWTNREVTILLDGCFVHGDRLWTNREVTILLDGCFVHGDRLQMLRLSLSHCYRALPLCWTVVATKGLVELAVCESLLDAAATLLRRTRRVTFLADRGFRDRDWAEKCRSLGWDYMIRLANNTRITFAKGQHIRIDQLAIRPGQRCFFDNVRITTAANWRCNVAITWTRETPTSPPEICAIMTNRSASGWVLRHYLRRMHIEESFRDEKSGGFRLQTTHLRDPKRLDMLLLAIAVATLWVYELGEQLLRDKQREEIDPAYGRQLSVFQLGWRWLRRAISCAQVPALSFRLKPFRLAPVWRGNPKC